MYSDLIKNITNYIHFSEMPSIIAGGALRDIDHGLAPKDIDIFVLTQTERYTPGTSVERAINYWIEDFLEINSVDFFVEAGYHVAEILEDVPENYREGNLANFIFQVKNFRLSRGRDLFGEPLPPIQVIFYNPETIEGYEPGETYTKKEVGKLITSTFDLNMSSIFTYRTNGDAGFLAPPTTFQLVKHPMYRFGKENQIVFPFKTIVELDPQKAIKTGRRMASHAIKLGYTHMWKGANETEEDFLPRARGFGAMMRDMRERRAVMNRNRMLDQFQNIRVRDANNIFIGDHIM